MDTIELLNGERFKHDEILELNERGLKSVLVMPIGYRAQDDMFADFKKVRKAINNSVIEL